MPHPRRRAQGAEPTPGSLNFDIELRAVLTKAIQLSGRTRDEIAAAMSEALGAEVTVAMLNAFTSPSRTRWRFPFEYAAAFEAAVGSYCLQELLARKRGTQVMTAREGIEAQLGQLAMREAEIREQREQLMVQLRTDAREVSR